MKSLFFKILLFSLPIVLIGFTLEFSLRNIPNDYKTKDELLMKDPSSIETLFLGSSHSLYGINPMYFDEKAFNLCHVSQSLDYDLALLKKYNTHLNKLKTVVLNIDYISLYWNLNNSPEKWRAKNYGIYYDIPDLSIKNNTEILSNKFKINLNRFYDYYILGNNNISIDENGWGNSYQTASPLSLEETGVINSQRHRDISDSSLISENLKSLMDIKDICAKNNLNLLIYSPPGYSTYFNRLDGNQLSKTIELIQDVSQNNAIKYLNLFKDQRFKKDDFYDADHLNKKGATKLSKILNKEI